MVRVALAEQVERNHRMACQHNRPEVQTAPQIRGLPHHSCLPHQTILIQTGQVQIHLHHPATEVAEDTVVAEEAADLAAVVEEAAAGEDNEQNSILYFGLINRPFEINFRTAFFINKSISHY